MLHDSVARHGQRVAVADGKLRLSFAALRGEAQRVANALAALGIAPGDRVAVWASNGWQWVAVACGIWLRGAVIVPLSSRWRATEVTPLLARTQARVLFAAEQAAGSPLLARLSATAGGGESVAPLARLPELQHVVSFDGGSAGLPGSAIRR